MAKKAKQKTAAGKNTKSEEKVEEKIPFHFSSLFPSLRKTALALAGGALLGLACPGFEQWYLAWFCLAPLFLLLANTPSHAQRSLIGFCFGLAYNLTYLHWYLNLAPLDWLGFSGLMGNFLATFAWGFAACHQALGFGLFGLLAGLLPLSGSFAFKKDKGQLRWPALLYLPLLYVLVINRLANAQDLMGVPWTQLEYTQYKQTGLLQAASIFGGIGVSYIIVVVNVAIASMLATVPALFSKKADLKRLAADSTEHAYYHCLAVALIVAIFIALGMWQKESAAIKPTVPVAIIQAGINIDMQKGEHTYSLDDLAKIYSAHLSSCKNELCIMTEGALPTYLREQEPTRAWLANQARCRHLDMVVGSMDKDGAGHPYNAAYGVTSSGKILPEVYHKRYLVPFGEYTPLLVEYFPEWVKRWTNTPAGGGFASGKEATNYAFSIGRIAPLICFECISPDQTAKSCRAGGEALVNISDLAWFHKSDCGIQMVAFSVLRAIENRRYVVFGANTGPAAIIDTTGKIIKYSPQGGESVVHGQIGLNPQKSLFSMWYR
ncbi:MAG: apolipoprotein N-acyltransferase [Cyanobacteria bacterium REEB67]|nr:apolipoprotein N-acyltransferase [Cyanobacteria bacterium REEB67]